MLLLLILACAIGASSFDERKSVPSHRAYSWKFREQNDLIYLTENELPRAMNELKHFVLFVHVNTNTFSKKKLYEFQKMSRLMKQELHPVPMAMTSDRNIYQSFNMQDMPIYVYFRRGLPHIYKGDKSSSDIRDWILTLRWPTSEPLTSNKSMQHIIKHSLTTVMFIGDNKQEEGYSNFSSVAGNFTHHHMRFVHTFDYKLKQPYLHQLPCVVVFSHGLDSIMNESICQSLSVDRLASLFERHKLSPHKTFSPGLFNAWFNHNITSIMVFIHTGVKTDQDRLAHRIFHQHLKYTHFGAKIGEVNAATKSGYRLVQKFHVREIPAIYILYKNNHRFLKYKLDLSSLTIESLIQFEQDFRSRSLKPHYSDQTDFAMHFADSIMQTNHSRLNCILEGGCHQKRYVLLFMYLSYSADHHDVRFVHLQMVDILTKLSKQQSMSAHIDFVVFDMEQNDCPESLESDHEPRLVLWDSQYSSDKRVMPENEWHLLDVVDWIKLLVL